MLAQSLEENASEYNGEDDHGNEAHKEVSGHVLLVVVAQVNAGCQLCKNKDIGKDDNQFLFEIHTLITGRVLLLKHALLLHQILFTHIHDLEGYSFLSLDFVSDSQNVPHLRGHSDRCLGQVIN